MADSISGMKFIFFKFLLESRDAGLMGETGGSDRFVISSNALDLFFFKFSISLCF